MSWSSSYFWTPIIEPLSRNYFDFGLFDITKLLQSQEANHLIEQRSEASKAGSTQAALMEIQQELFALMRQKCVSVKPDRRWNVEELFKHTGYRSDQNLLDRGVQQALG